MELGGKDALIVLDDADIEHAVNAATFGSFMHQGQICMSVERVIVHEAVAKEFTDKFVAEHEEVEGRQSARDGELHRPDHQSEAARQDPRAGR